MGYILFAGKAGYGYFKPGPLPGLAVNRAAQEGKFI